MWDRIQAVRNQELGTLWKSFIIQAFFGFTLNTIPVLVSVLTFGVYVLLGNKLSASKAFTSLALFTVRPSPLASSGYQESNGSLSFHLAHVMSPLSICPIIHRLLASTKYSSCFRLYKLWGAVL